MYFIAILITLGLFYYWGSFALLQKDDWFYLLLERARLMMSNPWLVYTVSVLFPCLVLMALLVFFRERIYGLISLVLAIAVLIYSMGRVANDVIIEKYKQLWQAGNFEQLPPVLESLSAATVDSDIGLQRLHVNAREVYLYNHFQGLFAVLFWFVLLGPAGALLYRLNLFFVSRDVWAISRSIQAILEWPAACLLSLTFALMGDFDKGIPVWRETAFNMGVTSKNMVHANGLAALDLDMEWLQGGFAERNTLEQQAQRVKDEITGLMQLMRRSLVFAVLVIAIIQIVI